MEQKKKKISVSEYASTFNAGAMLAKEIHSFIKSHPEYVNKGVSVIAYAVEHILGLAYGYKGAAYDKASAEFRDYLGQVHKDVIHSAAVIKKAHEQQYDA